MTCEFIFLLHLHVVLIFYWIFFHLPFWICSIFFSLLFSVSWNVTEWIPSKGSFAVWLLVQLSFISSDRGFKDEGWVKSGYFPPNFFSIRFQFDVSFYQRSQLHSELCKVFVQIAPLGQRVILAVMTTIPHCVTLL